MVDDQKTLNKRIVLRLFLLTAALLSLLFYFWQVFASSELCQYSSGDQTGAAEEFARLGGSIDGTDYKKRTPLIIASGYGNVELTCFLINKGANVNARDSDGNTPLLELARWSRVRDPRPWEDFPTTAGILIAYGAQTDANNNLGETATSLAEKHGDKQLLALLKKAQLR